MSRKSSGASTLIDFPASAQAAADPKRARLRSAQYLAEIEENLGLQPGAFAASLRDGKALPNGAHVASDIDELVGYYVSLSEEDRRRCLEFVRSLAQRA